jgi:hypothetical protein
MKKAPPAEAHVLCQRALCSCSRACGVSACCWHCSCNAGAPVCCPLGPASPAKAAACHSVGTPGLQAGRNKAQQMRMQVSDSSIWVASMMPFGQGSNTLATGSLSPWQRQQQRSTSFTPISNCSTKMRFGIGAQLWLPFLRKSGRGSIVDCCALFTSPQLRNCHACTLCRVHLQCCHISLCSHLLAYLLVLRPRFRPEHHCVLPPGWDLGAH